MGRPSDPVLKWLRALIDGRKLNTAALAEKSGLPRARLRRILTGNEPMLVDELLQISTTLEISPADMGLPEGTPEPDTLPLSSEAAPPGLDPWGNHVEQLFRVAFTLGCDFHFSAEAAALEGSGVPESVLRSFRDRALPIELKAQFHQYNNPRYDPGGITLTLSFDALYDCRFPWSSVRHVLFLPQYDPQEPDQDEQKETSRPHLRLVD